MTWTLQPLSPLQTWGAIIVFLCFWTSLWCGIKLIVDWFGGWADDRFGPPKIEDWQGWGPTKKSW